MSDRPANTVPAELQAHVDGYTFERTTLGKASETYRLTRRDHPTRYLKIASDLSREHARLLWAVGRLPVPQVVAFVASAAEHYLLLDELPGTPVEFAAELSIADRVCHLAQTMRILHSIPIAGCPFDSRIAARLADAEVNVREGKVDESDFDEERQGRSAASILAELRAFPSFTEDLVVTHGDFTLSNIFVNPAGLLDLGRLGIADRHQDIALVLRDIEGDFGAGWSDAFVTAYGIGAIDDTRITFFRLLDELF